MHNVEDQEHTEFWTRTKTLISLNTLEPTFLLYLMFGQVWELLCAQLTNKASWPFVIPFRLSNSIRSNNTWFIHLRINTGSYSEHNELNLSIKFKEYWKYYPAKLYLRSDRHLGRGSETKKLDPSCVLKDLRINRVTMSRCKEAWFEPAISPDINMASSIPSPSQVSNFFSREILKNVMFVIFCVTYWYLILLTMP